MNENGKNKNIIYLIIIFILLIIIAVLTTLVLTDDDKKIEENIDKEIVHKSDEKKKENKKLTDSELQNYISMVPIKHDASILKDAYDGDEIDLENVSKDVIYANIFDLTEKTSERPNSGVNGYNPSQFKECVTISNFNTNLKNNYNLNGTADEFNYPAGTVYKAENYYCNYIGAGITEFKKYNKILKYEYSDEDLIIYEKAGFATNGLGQGVLITKTSNYEESPITKVGVEAWTDAENYVKSNIDNFNTFKHSFEKINGKYYWHETEIEND